MNVSGKLVVVTGGASGIGAALCRRFAAEGARTVIVVDRSADATAAVAAEIGGVAEGERLPRVGRPQDDPRVPVACEHVRRFRDALRERGVSRFELSVDADNAHAVRFYERLGAARLGPYREFGESHVRFAFDLARDPAR